jgi:hypothetical protein
MKDQAERYHEAMAGKRGLRGMSEKIDADGKRHILPTVFVEAYGYKGYSPVESEQERPRFPPPPARMPPPPSRRTPPPPKRG